MLFWSFVVVLGLNLVLFLCSVGFGLYSVYTIYGLIQFIWSLAFVLLLLVGLCGVTYLVARKIKETYEQIKNMTWKDVLKLIKDILQRPKEIEI